MEITISGYLVHYLGCEVHDKFINNDIMHNMIY